MRKRAKRFPIVTLLGLLLLTSGRDLHAGELRDYLANLPFIMPEMREPQFPTRSLNITAFGAVADGRTLNTDSFAQAIKACAEAGGGTVVVPPGTWLTGPIALESNVNLHLERGALVQFSSNINDFPIIAGFKGTGKRYIVAPPISAYQAKNIAITGDGIFDGAGEAWRYVKKEKLTAGQWKDLTASGGVVSASGKEWWPSREAMEAEEYLKRIEKSAATAQDYAKAREYLRPDLVYLVQCTNVLLDGPTFENSPRFHIHPVQCEEMIIRNVKVLAPWYAQNADGIDLSSCRKVVMYNNTIDAGDDGLCLKPANISHTQTAGPACENIVIADCIVYHAHGGFVIGSESYGGVRNVSVRNCVFIGTDVGLRFKSSRDRGGVVERVFIDGIQMRNIGTDAILFDMYYAGGAPDVEATKDLSLRTAEKVTKRTPKFRDVHIAKVTCNGAKRAVVVNGLPEMPVKDLTLDSVAITAEAGIFLADAAGVTLNGCRIFSKKGVGFTIINGRDIIVKGGIFSNGEAPFARVAGEQSGNIRFIGIDTTHIKKTVEREEGLKPDAVRWE